MSKYLISASLKIKRGRLAITIILATITLALFGVADAFSSYDRARAMNETMMASGETTLAVIRMERGTENFHEHSVFTAEDVYYVRNLFPETAFWGMIENHRRFRFRYNHRDFPFYQENQIQKLAVATPVLINTFGLEIMAGRLPEKPNEIAITSYQFELLTTIGVFGVPTMRTYQDVFANEFSHPVFADERYSVVGIIDTGFNFERFEPLRGRGQSNDESIGYHVLAGELRSLWQYSLHNVLFVANDSLLTLPVLSIPMHDLGHMRLRYPMTVETGDVYRLARARHFQNQILFFDAEQTSLQSEQVALPLESVRFNNFHSLRAMKGEGGEYIIRTTFGQPMLSANTRHTVDIVFDEIEELKAELTVQMQNLRPFLDRQMLLYSQIWTPAFGWQNITRLQAEVVAIRWSQPGNFNDAIAGVFVSDYDLEEMGVSRYFSSNYASLIASITNSVADRELIRFLMEFDSQAPVRLLLRNQFSSFFESFTEIFELLSILFLLIGAGFVIFAALLLTNNISLTISYKKQEIGILRAIGAKRFDIYKIFFNQSVLITLINFVTSVIAVFVTNAVLNAIFGSLVGQPIRLLSTGIRQVAILFGVAIVVAVLSSFLPTRKISKMKPIDAIQNRK